MTTREHEQAVIPNPQEFNPAWLDDDAEFDDDISQDWAPQTGAAQELPLFDQLLRLGGGQQVEERTIQVESPGWRAMPTFIPLESWQGQVLEVSGETFTARLNSETDLTAEDAEFEIEAVSSTDMELLEPGAVFYWNVGYRVDPGGRRARQSVVSFRRLPAYSQSVLDEIAREATAISADLEWLREDGS